MLWRNPATGKLEFVAPAAPAESPAPAPARDGARELFFFFMVLISEPRGVTMRFLPPGWHPRAHHALSRQTPFRHPYLLLILQPCTSSQTPPVSGIWCRDTRLGCARRGQDPQAANLDRLRRVFSHLAKTVKSSLPTRTSLQTYPGQRSSSGLSHLLSPRRFTVNGLSRVY